MDKLDAFAAAGPVRVDSSASEVEEVARDDLFFELMRAVEDDELERVSNLLRILCLSEAAQLDSRVGLPSYGLSPLHCAMSAATAEKLLEFGLPVDLRGVCDCTPLISCAGRPGVVAVLLRHGASAGHATRDGATALHTAVLEDAELSVMQLLSAGADCNLPDSAGNACLHMVGGVEVAKLLVRHGASVEQTNNEGRIPLEEAVSKGRHRHCIEVAGFLFDASQARNQSKTKQLLDVLIEHVLNKPAGEHVDADEVVVSVKGQAGRRKNGGGAAAAGERSRIIPMEGGGGGGSSADESESDEYASAEEKAAFESTESVSADSKWLSVKQRMLGGGTKLVKLAAHPRRGGDWARDARAAFARRSRSGTSSSRALRGEFFHSFFELMVRERPELALMILNRQRRLLFQRLDCKTYSYSLELIGTPLRCTSAVRAMVDNNRYELITHPVTQWLITAKFATCTRYLLYIELVSSLVFLVLVVATFDPTPNHLGDWFAALGALATLSVPASATLAGTAGSALLALAWLALMVLNSREIMLRLVQFRVRVLRRGVNCKRRMGWMLLLGSDASSPGGVSKACEDLDPAWLAPHLLLLLRDWDWAAILGNPAWLDTGTAMAAECVLNTTVLLLVCLRALKYASGLYQEFGFTLTVMRRMLQDCRPYLRVLLLAVAMFAMAFSTLYQQAGFDEFDSVPASFVTLFFFVFNPDVTSILADPSPLRRTTAITLMGLYMVLVGLTLINLIIAVFTSSYDETSKAARHQAVLTRAAFVIWMEEYASRASITVFAIRSLGRWCRGASDPAPGHYDERCWKYWENKKNAYRSRDVFVREYPDGKVEVRTTHEIARFLLKAALPPFFLPLTKLYDKTNCFLEPMPLIDDFSWDKVDTTPRPCGKRGGACDAGAAEDDTGRPNRVRSVGSVGSAASRTSWLGSHVNNGFRATYGAVDNGHGLGPNTAADNGDGSAEAELDADDLPSMMHEATQPANAAAAAEKPVAAANASSSASQPGIKHDVGSLHVGFFMRDMDLYGDDKKKKNKHEWNKQQGGPAAPAAAASVETKQQPEHDSEVANAIAELKQSQAEIRQLLLKLGARP